MRHKLILCAAFLFFYGCSTQNASQKDEGSKPIHISIQKLKGILTSHDEVEFDPKKLVKVEGTVDLKHRGQQFLSLGEDDCLQLVIPDALANNNVNTVKANIRGHLLLISKDKNDLLTKYKVNDVDVYPYCTFTSNYFLVVDQLLKIK